MAFVGALTRDKERRWCCEPQGGEVEVLRNFQTPNNVAPLRARIRRPRQFTMPIGTTPVLRTVVQVVETVETVAGEEESKTSTADDDVVMS